jgi:hypothetical protein
VTWRVVVQVWVILLVATLGEHHISGMGYYYYTPHNGGLVGRVALWIPFLWVFVIQSTFVTMILTGVIWPLACIGSGMLAFLFDFSVLEPYMCRAMELSLWTQVDNGYYSFVPAKLNRFTAPVGNYFVWLCFPILANYLLAVLLAVFPWVVSS